MGVMDDWAKKLASAARRGAIRMWSGLWSLILDVMWLAALAIVVGAAVWSLRAYLAAQGQPVPPALDAAARVVGEMWKGVTGGAGVNN